jgi:protein-L-isoaspartate(D-aspartate) O-methyltransferase
MAGNTGALHFVSACVRPVTPYGKDIAWPWHTPSRFTIMTSAFRPCSDEPEVTVIMLNVETAREQMIAQQIRAWDVLDERVLTTFKTVRREEFVPEGYREAAFADTQIPLGSGQSMLPPMLDGRILLALELQAADEVLEVGAGSGFLAACLGTLAARVRSLEIFPDLAALAARNLRNVGVHTVSVETSDAMRFDETDCYDAIAVTGSLPLYDARFERALKPGGRLFIVTGTAPVMEALLVRRGYGIRYTRTSLFETDFAPLVNARQPQRFVF